MSPTEFTMQPTIHLERKAEYGRSKYQALPSRCIVGCIFNSVGLVILVSHLVKTLRITLHRDQLTVNKLTNLWSQIGKVWGIFSLTEYIMQSL
jgi:hypothetical protein